jgi:hypothetical protein
MSDSRYFAWRAEIEARFSTMRALDDEAEISRSPSGRYFLRITEYTAGPGTWNYSRGVVFREGSSIAVVDVRRNYGMFWHTWVQRNGREYLLCGEDYQGYNVIDLDAGTNTLTFPPEAYKGMGFCWGAVHPSPNGDTLAVDGCFWACPYELVIVDFTHPDQSPLPELARFDDLNEVKGWVNDREIRFTAGEEEPRETRSWRRELPSEV